jgi:hypothetical protein
VLPPRMRSPASRAPVKAPLYRAIAPLQRAYFDPPSDGRAAWDIGQDMRVNKLTAAPALEYGRDLRFTRFKVVG